MTSSKPVMIVDDDLDLRELLSELIQDEGYEVVQASHGAEALALLRSGHLNPSLILLDLMMPVLDGWAFRRAQMEDPALREIPVIVLTADVSAPARAQSSGIGFADFLLKPVSIDLLLQRVNENTRSSA